MTDREVDWWLARCAAEDGFPAVVVSVVRNEGNDAVCRLYEPIDVEADFGWQFHERGVVAIDCRSRG